MKQLEGAPLAEALLETLREEVSQSSRIPGIAAVLVGDNTASKLYVSLKKKAAHRCHMMFCDYLLPKDATQEMVQEVIEHLNGDDEIDGILVQLPLPEHLDRERILNAIDPKKDVDGLTQGNAQCLKEEEYDCFVCPFPKAIVKLLTSARRDVSELKGYILTRSHGFGSYMVNLLRPLGMDSEYWVYNEDESIPQSLRNADVVISAVGVAGLVRSEDIKDGAIVIDGGIEKKDNHVRGDVLWEDFKERAVMISPVPGGVGPVTVACLLENVWLSSKRKKKV